MDADRIELRGLRLAGIVGVLPEERTRAQPLEIDIDLELDLGRAGSSDDLTETVDYGSVCDNVAEVVHRLQPRLLERLASEVAASVLNQDERVVGVRVSVSKLRPPVPHLLDRSGVVVTRRRS